MILAVDVGSSAVKGALFSDSGALEGRAEAPVGLRPGEDPSFREASAGDWVAALRLIAARLLAGRRGLEAIAISGQGPTLVPTGADGSALHPALTWMDRRATAEADMASAAAGSRIDSSFNLPKALWIMRRKPELYDATAAFLSCPEYLGRLLVGEAVSIIPAGYERHYGDASTLAALGLDSSKFPAIARPGFLLGATTAAGEEATGLPRGAKVVLVGPDFLAAIVGAATTRPGRACDRAGSSEGINLCALEGTRDPRLVSVPHVVPPYANVSGMISTTGAAVDWFRRAYGLGEAGYEEFFAEAAAAGPGAGGAVFLPYLSGERAPIWDPAARGAFVGIGLEHGRPELARAVLESTAFAMRDVIEAMEGAGAALRELRVAGKPGRSELWNQVKADVTGRPISTCAFPDAELLGGLCFALAALGLRASPAEAAEELSPAGRTFEPDPARKALYDGLFGIYRETYAALKDVFRMDSGAMKEEG